MPVSCQINHQIHDFTIVVHKRCSIPKRNVESSPIYLRTSAPKKPTIWKYWKSYWEFVFFKKVGFWGVIGSVWFLHFNPSKWFYTKRHFFIWGTKKPFSPKKFSINHNIDFWTPKITLKLINGWFPLGGAEKAHPASNRVNRKW